MPTWFEALHFAKDPYEKLDPYKIDLKYLAWDRPDLDKAARNLYAFVKDILDGRRTGLKVFGSAGSGKTWFTRIIEKETLAKNPRILFIYTKVPRLEPTFQVVYRLAIQDLLDNYFDKIARYVKETQKGETDLNAWKNAIGDEDLATAFQQYYSGTNKALSKKWLTGDKLSAYELDSLKVTRSLDSDYDRFEMLIQIFEKLSSVFSTSMFVIDELENASVKLAGQLSDSLRDMLDRFAEKFALVASFTAQKDEEWYDLGYTEQLNRRFDYAVKLEALDKVADFLRIHQQAYRKPDVKINDQLYPFTEEGAVSLLEIMQPGNRYPGYYLPNCRDLAKLCAGKPIDADFVKKNQNWLSFK